MIRCVTYSRLSTQGQVEGVEYSSIEAQTESCKAYIKSQAINGWKHIDSYSDISTGGDLVRPGLQQLLEDAKKGKFDVVVCTRIDRLSRSIKDFLELNEIFERHNIKFVCTTQDFNTTTAAGRMFLKILVSFGEYERELISERTKIKMRAQAEKGFWHGGAVNFGFDKNKLGKGIVVNEKEAKVVKLIFNEYVKTESTSKVAEKINRLGHRTKLRKLNSGRTIGGKKFTRSYIAELLQNPIYIGKIRYRGDIYDSNIPPLIDESLFNQVQNIIRNNREPRNTPNRNKYNFLLKGLVRCSECGSVMTPTPAKSGDFLYYRCTAVNHTTKEACKIKSAPAKELENAVIYKIKQLSQNDTELREVIEKANREFVESSTSLLKEKSKYESNLKSLNKSIRQFLNTIEKGSVQIKFIEDELKELDRKKIFYEDRIEEIKKQVEYYRNNLIDFNKMKENLSFIAGSIDEFEPKLKKNILRLFIEGVTFYTEKIRISLRDLTSTGLSFSAESNRWFDKIQQWLPSVVSERTPLEFYIIPKYYHIFDKGLRRGRKIDFSKTIFQVV